MILCMQWIVDHFYLFILAVGVTHFFVLLGLWAARQRRAKDLSFYLYNLVKRNAPAASTDLLITIASLPLAPIAALLELIAGLRRRGGTIAVVARACR